MSADNVDTNECVFETPVTQRSIKRVHQSVTNLRSQSKRRRLSVAAFDFGEDESHDPDALGETSRHPGGTADRFISNRPGRPVPLNITPRTNRISKQFGLIDDRVLSFKDDTEISLSSKQDETTMALLRRSASSLFNTAPPLRSSSVTENLNKRKQCLMVLDSPGMPYDLESSPISWSPGNLIAVACSRSVFYQNLDTKAVVHLCSARESGHFGVLEWGHENHAAHIASGMSTGHLHIWDANTPDGQESLHNWYCHKDTAVKSLSWNREVLAVGAEDSEISLIDVRKPELATNIAKHKGRILALKWSADRTYLASGDSNGIVHIWDNRNTREPLTKLRHKGATKALAWCPWKRGLLATGSFAPEGKIRIWNTTSLSSHSPEPLHTLMLNTTVLSLQWSPHCKELLSTQGRSFTPLPPSPPPRRELSLLGLKAKRPVDLATKLTYTQTPLTNSIVVHEYPSGKCLMTLTNAHKDAVTQSCLSPSGESVFTVCPKEETIKMWKVWDKRPSAPRPESAFDRFTIR